MAVDYEEGLRHLAAMEISPRNDGISPRIVGIFWDLHSNLTTDHGDLMEFTGEFVGFNHETWRFSGISC
jgi:hypothetical protein